MRRTFEHKRSVLRSVQCGRPLPPAQGHGGTSRGDDFRPPRPWTMVAFTEAAGMVLVCGDAARDVRKTSRSVSIDRRDAAACWTHWGTNRACICKRCSTNLIVG